MTIQLLIKIHSRMPFRVFYKRKYNLLAQCNELLEVKDLHILEMCIIQIYLMAFYRNKFPSNYAL